MPQEKDRRILQLENDILALVLSEESVITRTTWKNPRTGQNVEWTRKARDIFYKLEKRKKELASQIQADK